MRKLIALAGLVVALGLVNWSIFEKEQHLKNGDIVYLELAPVDPRSLMQGDYMTLRFAMSNEIRTALPTGTKQNTKMQDGEAVVTLDSKRVATFHSLNSGQSLGENQLTLRYRVRKGRIKFATNAFFFQEGHAQLYEDARYGQFRVNDKGDILLAALFDENLTALGPE